METNNTKDKEVLTFKIGNEEYGIDILKVREIRGYESVTRIANAQNFVKGIINLRGVVVPIIDMRILFNLGTPTYDQFTVVIILNLNEKLVGVVVDGVSDVTSLSNEQIHPAPSMGVHTKGECLQGLGTLDERMLILLDIDKLLGSEDINLNIE